MKEWSTLKKLIWLRKINGGGGGSDPLNTFTGVIARFFCREAKPIVKLEANFTPIQNLHGYDNPWPAGGGKNKFLADFENQTVNGTTYTLQSDGKITTSGVPSSATDLVVGHVFLPAGTYILNGCPANGGSGKYRLQVTDYPVVNNLGQDAGEGVEFTISTGMEVAARIQMYTGAPSSLTFAPMIRLATETDATFAPYSNICPISGHTGADIFVKDEYDAQATPTVTISFGQTVYGGTLTVNEDGSGQIVADRAGVEYDGSDDENWVSRTDNNHFFAIFVGSKGYLVDHNCVSNIYKQVNISGSNTYIGVDAINSTGYNGAFLEVRPLDYQTATLATFRSSLSAQPVQLVYELATPITIPLTASQINTLVGENNVWVNAATGDITVQAYGTEIT